jgi:hypothetical protein
MALTGKEKGQGPYAASIRMKMMERRIANIEFFMTECPKIITELTQQLFFILSHHSDDLKTKFDPIRSCVIIEGGAGSFC